MSNNTTHSSLTPIRTTTVLAVLVVSFLGLPGSADAGGLEIEARYWAPSLTSSLGLTGLDLAPDLNTNLDLGLDADEVFEGRLTLRPGLGLFLRGAYQTVSAAGVGSLSVRFGDFEFPLPATIVSNLDFDYGRLALGWQYVNDDKSLRIGPFVEAKGVRGDAFVMATALDMSVDLAEPFEGGVLSAGGLIELRPSPRLQIFLEASTAVEDDLDFTDAEAGVRFFLTDTIGLGGGYRLLDVDGTIDGVRLALELDGVFASVVFDF